MTNDKNEIKGKKTKHNLATLLALPCPVYLSLPTVFPISTPTYIQIIICISSMRGLSCSEDEAHTWTSDA